MAITMLELVELWISWNDVGDEGSLLGGHALFVMTFHKQTTEQLNCKSLPEEVNPRSHTANY